MVNTDLLDARIDKCTENFIGSFSELTKDELNWKQNSNSWSIAQNIDHIIKINESYFSKIEEIRADTYKAPFVSKLKTLVNITGNALLKAVAPDRNKKTKTFGIFEPIIGEIEKTILEKFSNHQTELKARLHQANKMFDQGTVISSPVNRYIVLSLEKAFEIMITHEFRHFEQSIEVLNTMNTHS